MTHTARWTSPYGTPLTLRPVRAEDAPALNTLIEGLPKQDLRWRFHGAVSGVPREQFERMACVDPLRELALVVTTASHDGERVLADARCVIDGRQAEFALMVDAAWRRHGIGRRALVELRRAAAQRGLRWLHGTVLADNTPMLALLQRAGFTVTRHRADRSLMAAEVHIPSPITLYPTLHHARPSRTFTY